MQRIPNIDLNEEQLKELTVGYKISAGSEGVVCEGIQSNTVAKIARKKGEIIPLGDNKEHKIIELYKKQLEHSSIPVRTISHNGNIVGYEMTTDPRFDKYARYQLTYQELKQILLKSKEIIQYFLSQDVIYADTELRNILFNRETGEIFFCDMDNTQIGEYPMDLIPSILEHYNLSRGIDEAILPYSHNYFTIRLFDLDPYETRFTIRKYFKRPGYKIIQSMQQPETFIEDYCVKYMKK